MAQARWPNARTFARRKLFAFVVALAVVNVALVDVAPRAVALAKGCASERAVVQYGPLATEVAGVAAQPALAAAPIALLVHGGGWTSGARTGVCTPENDAIRKGFVVVNIDYPLATPTSPGWTQQVQSVRDAVAWAQLNGPAYGGDPNQIVMIGFSAGGNLAYEAGNLINADAPGTIAAVVGVSGVVDLTNRISLQGPTATYLGCAQPVGPPLYKRCDPAVEAAASPLHTLGPTCPHLFVANSVSETTVPLAEAQRFVDAATSPENGCSVETDFFRGSHAAWYGVDQAGTTVATRALGWLCSAVLSACVVNRSTPGLAVSPNINLVGGKGIWVRATSFPKVNGAGAGDQVGYYFCNMAKAWDDSLANGWDAATTLATDCRRIGTTQTLMQNPTNHALFVAAQTGVTPMPGVPLGTSTDPDTACPPTAAQIQNESDSCDVIAQDLTTVAGSTSADWNPFDSAISYVSYKPGAPAVTKVPGDVSIAGAGLTCVTLAQFSRVSGLWKPCPAGENFSVILSKAGIPTRVGTGTAAADGTYTFDLGTVTPGAYKVSVQGETSKLVSSMSPINVP